MAPNQIDAIARKFISNDANALYQKTMSFTTVNSAMSAEERVMAFRGMTFTQPDTIPSGINGISGGACGGGLGFINPRYDENGMPPVTSMAWIG